MKKLFSSALLALLLTLSTTVSAVAAPYSIIIDQTPVAFTEASGQPFLDKNERTQVPLRSTMEAFGCKVEWNEAEKTAIVKKDATTVRVPVGQSYILVNNQKQAIDTAAIIRDGRTYLPIRAVLEAFGANVSWNQSQNAVIVTSTVFTNGNLQIHFLDVGQADCILIDNGSYEVVIDGGNNKDGKNVVNYLADYIDGALEVVIATHPDADHIGGLDDVILSYDVRKIIDSGETKETKTYADYWAAVSSEQNCEVIYDCDMTLDLGGGVKLEIIETGDGYKDTNDNSVVALLTYGGISVLLTGDMEKAAEAASLSRYHEITVLKAGHHGSQTSSSQAFLDLTKPKYVILSAGKNNSYKHPHKAVLQRYFDMNATVYGTFKSGTIVMTTDGKTLSFDTSDEVVLSDAGDY